MRIDYLNFDNPVRNNERAKFSQSSCNHCGGSHPTEKCLKKKIKENGCNKTPLNSRNSNNERNECNGWKPNKCFRCGLEDNFILNCPRTDTSDNKVNKNTEKP